MRKRGLLLFALLLLLIVPLTAFAQAQADPADGGEISVGDSIDGELTTDEPAIAYTIEGEAGQSLTILLTAEAFDCYLTLLDEEDNEIAFNDDGAGNLDSLINVTLPTDGTYTIVAQSYSYRNGSSSPGTGDFTLSVDEVQVNQIEYSQTVEGRLTSSELQVRYVFTGTEGDVIIAEHYSEDYDSYLTLEFNGSEIAYNDDGAGNLDSRIGPFTLPSTGSYTLVVTSLSRADTGSYEVRLDRVEVQSIEIGEETTVEFTPSDSVLFFMVEAQLGDIISIEVDSEIDTSLSISDPSNYTVISDEDSGSGFNPEIIDFSLSQAGTYTVALRSVNGEAGEATITISRAELPSLNDGPQTISFSSSVFNRTLVFDAEAGTTYRLTLDVVRGDSASPSIDITQAGNSLGYTSTSRVERLSIDITPSDDGEVVLRFSEYSYTNISIEVTLEEVGE